MIRKARAAPPYVVRVRDKTLYIQGTIDEVLANMVETTVHTSKEPITQIKLISQGGQEVARSRISSYLADLKDVPLEIPDRAICWSACIGILANAPGPVKVSAAATLLFHAGIKRVGLASSGFCGCLNRLFVWFSPLTSSEGERRVMLPWATTINDKLPSLFKLCKKYPLDSEEGMLLTGAELDKLKAGKIEPEALVDHCPSS